LLAHYNGSHIKAIIDLYPEIDLKQENFSHHADNNWKDPINRRAFFDTLAKSKKFDPLEAKKWSTVSYKDVIQAGGGGILHYYNGSHTKALKNLFTELHFNPKAQRQKNLPQVEKTVALPYGDWY